MKCIFFFQAEDGIRDADVTGVQTCALPILGHLRVLEVVTGVRAPGVFVEVALHVATLGSVLVVYGARLWRIVRGVAGRRPEDLRTAGLLVLGTVPAGVIGALFHHQVEAAATSLVLVGTGFILTGFMNWSTRRLGGGARPEPTVAGAVGIGFAQAVAAVFRGVSRSGSTVCAALWGGLAPAPAAAVSFPVAVTPISGAAVLHGP